MELDPEDIKRLMVWFGAVEDLNYAFLEQEDRDLMERLKSALARETLQGRIGRPPEF